MTVSIVTQTSVRPEKSEDFARWQGETSNMVSSFAGFVEQRLMPPNPPLQVDWVILQRFHTMEDAQRWLASPERQTRIEGAAPFLIGRDDVHIVRDDEGGRKPAPVSAVISTRVKPGKDVEYRAWERPIAAAQSKGAPAPWAVWKMDFIVLLLLYPIVFLWGVYAGTPILQNKLNLPWAVNLFIGNIFSVALTGFMVPWVANHMGWWMNPKGNVLRANLLGALLVCAIYAACIWIFWKFF